MSINQICPKRIRCLRNCKAVRSLASFYPQIGNLAITGWAIKVCCTFLGRHILKYIALALLVVKQGYNISPRPKSPAVVNKSPNFRLQPPTKNGSKLCYLPTCLTSVLKIRIEFTKNIYISVTRENAAWLYLFQQKSKFGRFLEGKQILDLNFLTAKLIITNIITSIIMEKEKHLT